MKTLTISSAVIFSAVTLATFWNLQEAGPEGTLRRFFESAAAGDQDAVERVVMPTDHQPDALAGAEQVLVRQAQRIGQVGIYRARMVKRESRQAQITIVSEEPGFGLVATTWVLTRPSLRWAVDLKKTVYARAYFGTNFAPEPNGPRSGLMDRF